jgi:hypothetical protein
MSSTYKFGVELEMFLKLKNSTQDVNVQKLNRGDLIKVADNIVSFYNSSIRSNSSSGEQEVRYPSMSRPTWERQTKKSILTEWEIHNDFSLYPLGIGQRQDCM